MINIGNEIVVSSGTHYLVLDIVDHFIDKSDSRMFVNLILLCKIISNFDSDRLVYIMAHKSISDKYREFDKYYFTNLIDKNNVVDITDCMLLYEFEKSRLKSGIFDIVEKLPVE